MLNNLKLTLDSNRKLISIECDDFRVKLNGKDNATYRKLFKELGLEIVFTDDPVIVDFKTNLGYDKANDPDYDVGNYRG